KTESPFEACTAQMVRDCWDAGLSLGHSIRTIGESISLARQEPEIATALLEARLLYGNEAVFETFRNRFRREVVRSRLRKFLDDCIAARYQERVQQGNSASQLEPDIKRSLGGLRDVHLIRWIGFACYGTTDIDSLRLAGALNREEARTLLAAREFLIRVRNDLHFKAGRCQDVLTREDQLQIARQRHIEGSEGQRPVERFMQTYFQHCSTIAEIAGRFVEMRQSGSISSRIVDFFTTRRINRVFKIGKKYLDVIERDRESICGDREKILEMYSTSIVHQVIPTPQISHRIQQSLQQLECTLSPRTNRLFFEILASSGCLGSVLRNMYHTGVLELVLPEMKHARCLLQFNQYHSFTVDEHTLRAVEAAERFDADPGPVGTAYRLIRHKEILHLALLLHDLGKGFKEDHSDVGRDMAERVATRFDLPKHHRETLMFLVHKHLKMAHLAFRRDLSDPHVLLEFAHEVGSPETLRMLFVLTAADLTAVGPDIWTSWKADLLSELYDKAMLVLSGKPHRFGEAERLQQIKDHVLSSVVPLEPQEDPAELKGWIEAQLDAFPPHYLSGNSPDRIAANLSVIHQLKAGEVVVESRFDHETGIVDLQIITAAELADGCFHKTAGVLTAKHLQILSAQISTSLDGVVIDSYKVLDAPYVENVSQERIEEIKNSIRIALTRKTSVSQLFQKHMRFDSGTEREPVSELPMRVVVDNDSSDHSTVIDIFAHDRPGLLYTITRSLYQMGLSVMLSKIATHLDQVVDVFYVTDSENRKIKDSKRLVAIQEDLLATLEEFEREGYLRFIP
ncbi:MAG: [protein-PII] uridylyltransferase, partial [Planctomycetes bacterium]|nr:[protein-PII] uridylyltransferase [Planctomycetota bacterium]